jgi:hypothetical protein
MMTTICQSIFSTPLCMRPPGNTSIFIAGGAAAGTLGAIPCASAYIGARRLGIYRSESTYGFLRRESRLCCCGANQPALPGRGGARAARGQNRGQRSGAVTASEHRAAIRSTRGWHHACGPVQGVSTHLTRDGRRMITVLTAAHKHLPTPGTSHGP